MKTTTNYLITAAALFAIVCIGLAQGLVHSGRESLFDPKEPPPTSLPDAYVAVLTRLGKATNRFHCISATCLEQTGYRGWTFTFANTNGEMARIHYFFAARTTYISDAKSDALLKGDKP